MKFFPMFLRMEDRRVVIVGGGETAAQKARLMLKTEAHLVFAAPELDAELVTLVETGRAEHFDGPITPELFKDAALCFIGSGCPGLDASIHAMAREAGVLVNVVDQPPLCEATTPSIVDRDPLVVAIGTEGAAPVLGRQVKTKLEEWLEPNLGSLVGFAARLRDEAAYRLTGKQRRAFWRWVFAGEPRALFAKGAEREASAVVKEALASGGAPENKSEGRLALLSVGSNDPDLMTLRAVQRLQEADLIICEEAEFAPILELARRDAARVIVGQTPGTADWRLSDQRELAMDEFGKGDRVAWLVSRRDMERAALGLPEATERVPSVRI